ncbi:classical arabinogalactan protein 10-like [Penaeus chinensis]|uniref:classical arabinogalactan protein 10-like n=1 Tax=Penaeus chinensis TaxID=139456 RepID=UPI001FB66190|nr:classical arabinogalactan protein 10-like [Penaeus chinensis]
MLPQLLVSLVCMSLAAATPFAQAPLPGQEGYQLQAPARIPSEVFSAPTVPPPPPPTPSQLYATPRQQEQEPAAAQQPTVVEDAPRAVGPPAPPPMEGMPYEFEWDVNDVENGLVYSHQESSDGVVAQGEYRVLLPDGRLQIVTFADRGQGYEAQVVYQDYNV